MKISRKTRCTRRTVKTLKAKLILLKYSEVVQAGLQLGEGEKRDVSWNSSIFRKMREKPLELESGLCNVVLDFNRAHAELLE